MFARLLLLFGLWLITLPAHAQIAWATVDEVVSIEVLPGWREADGRHIAALHVRLEPGWKTYWRRPGSAGIAPSFDWRRSRNAVAVTPQWPTPGVFLTTGMQSIGYQRDVVLPLVIQPKNAGAPIRLRGVLQIGVCSDICLPAKIKVSADLPVGGTPNPLILNALADQPRVIQTSATCRLRPADRGLSVTSEIHLPTRLGNVETVIFEPANPRLWVTDATVTRRGATLRASSQIMAGAGEPVVIDRSTLRITILGARGAVEIRGCTGG